MFASSNNSLALLPEIGMRIGQALGLRHGDCAFGPAFQMNLPDRSERRPVARR